VKVVDIVPISKDGVSSRVAKEEEDISQKQDAFLKSSRGSVASSADDIEEMFDFDESFPLDGKKKNKQKKEPRVPSGRGFLWWGIGIVCAVGLLAVSIFVLPRADITIVAQKIQWSFDDGVVVDKAQKSIDVKSLRIPGEILSEQKSVVLTFPATGEKYVERKARGIITIYNAYSSAPQTLVATTRFEAPDGKIFRLVDKVTVPAAKVVGGVIQPSSIDATVVADKAGSEYNVGPIEKFTIPGFSGTDRYQGFYGSSSNAMTGGYTGTSAYPTDSDIEAALEGIDATIKNALVTSFTLDTLPREFTYIKDSGRFVIEEPKVNTEVNEKNEFSVTAIGEMSAIAFRESDVKELLDQAALEDNGVSWDSHEQRSFSLTMGDPEIDWDRSLMRIPVSYETVLAYRFDVEKIKNDVRGKKESDLKTYVLSLSGIERMTASLWPFWVRKVPDRISHVRVSIE